jgi:hypothetical protein
MNGVVFEVDVVSIAVIIELMMVLLLLLLLLFLLMMMMMASIIISWLSLSKEHHACVVPVNVGT